MSDDFPGDPEITKQAEFEEGEDDEGIVEMACQKEGMRLYKVFGTDFLIPDYYEIVEPLGAGAYGLVVAAVDTRIETTEEDED